MSEQQLSRAERYQLSLKQREEGKAKSGFDYPKEEHPEYCTAQKGTPMLFRPMTIGSELDPKTPYGHRYFYYSFMKDDEGKYFPFKFGFETWYKHPIYQIVKKIAKYEYDKETRSKKYENAGCELLLDITHNGDTKNTLASGWEPNKTLLMNVIDRMDSWCKENRHSKIATNKAEMDTENDRMKTDYGLKPSQYTDILELADKQLGSIADFDLLTIKYKKPKQVGDKKEYYETLLAENNKPYITATYGEEFTKAIFDDYDEDEMSYEMYNFDEMMLYKPSSIGFFLSKKSKFIKDVDAKYHTNFFEEFTKLANEEKLARGEKVDEVEDTKEEGYEKVETKEDVQEQPTTHRRSVKVEETKAFNPLTDLDLTKFKGISKMPQNELDKIKGIDSEGNLIFVDGLTLDGCEKCPCVFDVTSTVCPMCGAEYI